MTGTNVLETMDDFLRQRSVNSNRTMNVLCMGGRTVGPAVAWDLVQTFLAAKFSQAERHVRRLSKVASIEADRKPYEEGEVQS